jgi:hypothetical protein
MMALTSVWMPGGWTAAVDAAGATAAPVAAVLAVVVVAAAAVVLAVGPKMLVADTALGADNGVLLALRD